MKISLYARVSTDDKNQNPETQLLPLREHCKVMGYEEYKEYVDYARAKDYIRRKAWQQLEKDIRQRKTNLVIVYKLDRAFRSVKECVNCLDEWYQRGVKFRSISQDIDTSTSTGKFTLHVLAAAAELESGLISDRVTAGMARARAEGIHLGRKLLNIDVTRIYNTLESSGNIRAAAKVLGCSRAYIYQELAKHGTTPKEVLESVKNGSPISHVQNGSLSGVSE